MNTSGTPHLHIPKKNQMNLLKKICIVSLIYILKIKYFAVGIKTWVIVERNNQDF